MPLRWKKKFGQHLLHDHNILRKIVSALALSPGEVVIEIGSGSGALTKFLLENQVTVYAVELDPQFYDALRRQFENKDNFNLITGDILEVQLGDIVHENAPAVVVGNLPYNITSQILFHMFSQRDFVTRMVFTAQKEVALRITAPVHTKDRSILSVLCQFHTYPKILFHVSRNCFFPRPQVDSSVISLILKAVPGDVHPDALMSVVKTCFSQRRKTLKNSLGAVMGADIDGLAPDFDLNRRPEELKVDDFLNLTRVIYSHKALQIGE